jgi:predicted small metal-binding protein
MPSIMCADLTSTPGESPCQASFHASTEDEVIEEFLRHAQKEHPREAKMLGELPMEEALALLRSKIMRP